MSSTQPSNSTDEIEACPICGATCRIVKSNVQKGGLRKVFNEWSNNPTRVVTFREPHEGQVQFWLLDPEPAPGGNLEANQVSQGIVEQITGEESDEI